MKYTRLFLFCWFFSTSLLVGPYVFCQEVYGDSDGQYLKEMDEGIEMMNKGEFINADAQFKAVLAVVEIVPADLCFYFGKNSYHLGKYKQSIDWLNKYIELDGTAGPFFDQAVEYLELAKADYQAERNKKIKQKKAVAESKSDASEKEIIDCKKHPYVTCPVCKGTGVLVEPGRLGSSIYKNCPYSDEHGRMTCEDYKLYVRGKLYSNSENKK